MFDAHAHYHDKAFDDDREEVLKLLKNKGIKRIFEAGENMAGSLAALETAERYKGDVYPEISVAAGLHPLYIEGVWEDELQGLEELLKSGKAAAVGECGLDYRGIKDEAVRKRQREVFEAQLCMCEEYGLPAVVHSLDAAEDTLRLLRAHKTVTGLLHGFAYSAEVAAQCVALGWKIGIGTVITRPEAAKIKKVAVSVPAESILVESDAPYMPVFGNKGRNDSLSIFKITEAVNKLREEAGAEKICQKPES
ncbi:MAG: TatD family hydrolase [Lachnospiraceae bacterium]|nr:TatD family hydrolase [Lachnospiraceae bacterium]